MLLALTLQDQVVSIPAWVGTVTAISLVIIALAVVSVAVAAVWMLKTSAEQLQRIGHILKGVDDDLLPAFKNVKQVTEQGKELVVQFKDEAAAIVRTSRRMRRRVRRGADRVQERLQDLDALYEVVHEELEEAALTLASVVRTVRTGGGVLSRIRRFLPGRRRRRVRG